MKGTFKMVQTGNAYVITLVPELQQAVPEPIDIVDDLPTNLNAQWPFPKWDRKLEDIHYITYHHSAGSRSSQNIMWWHRYHTGSKSWSRVGYHYGIAALNPGEEIKLYQLNYESTTSWHDTRNYDTLGVCTAGDLREGHDVEPNAVQLDCWGRLCYHLVPQLPNLRAIVGHKYWQATACPGDIERWGQQLVDAAAKYDVDISGLLIVSKSSALTRLQANVASLFGRDLVGPPLGDYNDI